MLKKILVLSLVVGCKTRNFEPEVSSAQSAAQSADANVVLANCSDEKVLDGWNFPPSNNYSIKSAEEKRNVLWNIGVLNSCYKANQLPNSAISFSSVSVFNPKFLEGSFDLKEDWNLSGRKKLIHSKGSVVKVRFVPNEYSKMTYTGMYQTGAVGLARLSLATGQSKDDNAPGMALKFFASGKELSRDLFVMFSVDGQGADQNFFAKDFANVVPAPTSIKTKLLVQAFKSMKSNPNRMKVSHLATVNSDGSYVSASGADIRTNFKTPVNLVFKPRVQGWSAADQTDFRINLIKYVSEGTLMYDVYALTGSHEVLDYSSAKLIGALVAESEPIPSKFGDDFLWFSHAKGD